MGAGDFLADARTIGIIFSVSSIGGVIGSLVAPWFNTRIPLGPVVVGSVILRAIVLPFLVGSVSILMIIVTFCISRFLWPIYRVAQLSYRLSVVPDALQGRVNSNIRLLLYSAESLGAALGGLLLEFFGARIVLWSIAIGIGFTAVAITFSDVRKKTGIQK